MKSTKYLVKKKKPSNNAFNAYMNIAKAEPGDDVIDPIREKESAPSAGKKPVKSTLPYRKDSMGIVDVYQAETSNEDEGENILRFELANGTVRDFVVKNGKKGSSGNDGLGGIRGPRGAAGPAGPAGPKGDPPSVGLRYDESTGNLYYDVSNASVLDEEAF